MFNTLIELRLALIPYQDDHMFCLCPLSQAWQRWQATHDAAWLKSTGYVVAVQYKRVLEYLSRYGIR